MRSIEAPNIEYFCANHYSADNPYDLESVTVITTSRKAIRFKDHLIAVKVDENNKTTSILKEGDYNATLTYTFRYDKDFVAISLRRANLYPSIGQPRFQR